MGLRTSSPTNFILAEIKEPHLDLRTDFLCKSFVTRIFSQPEHPIIPTLLELQTLKENLTLINKIQTPIILEKFMEISAISHLIESNPRPLCFSKPYKYIFFKNFQINLEDGINFDKSSHNNHPLFCDFRNELENSFCVYTDGFRSGVLGHRTWSLRASLLCL